MGERLIPRSVERGEREAREWARRHPLALDLVDYVERSRTPSITLHLRTCRSCRQGVWNICGDDDVRRELFRDVDGYRPDLGDAPRSTNGTPS